MLLNEATQIKYHTEFRLLLCFHCGTTEKIVCGIYSTCGIAVLR